MPDKELDDLLDQYLLTTDEAEAEELLTKIHAEYEKRGQLVKNIA
jgi:hypothetical protein